VTAEEFQRRMKAEKDRQKQQKNQSAQFLHGYRGGVKEDEMKLRALKEEERKKQLDAENNLRGYRGNVAEEDLKLKAMKDEERQKHLDAQRVLHSYQAKATETNKAKQQRDQQPTYPPPVTGPQPDNVLESIAAGSVSAKAASFNINQTTSQDSGAAGSMSESSKVNSGFTTEQIAESIPIQSFEEMNVGAQVTSVSEPESRPNLSQRFDLFFSFGIVTESRNPQYASYMNAVSAIVTDAVANNSDVCYEPTSNPPFVQHENWDGKNIVGVV